MTSGAKQSNPKPRRRRRERLDRKAIAARFEELCGDFRRQGARNSNVAARRQTAEEFGCPEAFVKIAAESGARPERDGIAEVIRNGEVRFLARVVLKDPETGERRELTRTFDSYSGAVDGRKALEDEAERIRRGVLSLSAPRTLGELVKSFEANVLSVAPVYDPASGAKLNRGYAPRLLVSLKAHLRKYLEAFGSETEVRAITPAMLAKFREQRLAEPVTFRHTRGALKGEAVRDPGKLTPEEFETLTPAGRAKFPAKTRPRSLATCNREMAFLRRLLSYAVQVGSIESNPFGRRSGLIASERHKTRTLSLEEEERLLMAATHQKPALAASKAKPEGFRARSGRKPTHLKPLIVLLLETGLRISEGLALQWEHIDLASRRIEIRPENTKTRRGRFVPVTDRLARELLAIRPANASGRIFGDLKSIRKSFATACRIAKLEGVTPHVLRHTAASRLASRLPVPEVGNLLGHASLETTRRYMNPTEERLTRAAEALEAYRTEETAKTEERSKTTAESEQAN